MQVVQEVSEEDKEVRKKDKTNKTDFIDYLNTDSGKLLIKMAGDEYKVMEEVKNDIKAEIHELEKECGECPNQGNIEFCKGCGMLKYIMQLEQDLNSLN